jgi:hypothetical protein
MKITGIFYRLFSKMSKVYQILFLTLNQVLKENEMKYGSIFIFIGVLFLSGCVLSKSSVARYAETKDFAAIAVADVKEGIQARSNEQLRQLGAVNNAQMTEYYSAYDKTLNTYCKPDNAFLYAIEGLPENKACVYDTPLGKLFQFNWEQGKKWQTPLDLFLDRGML